jgi:site-specific DNA-adenine methylase
MAEAGEMNFEMTLLDEDCDRPARIRCNKAPFPWFGGKSRAAPLVWALLGDAAHYVEPFCGTMAVLLERPHPCNRPYFSETISDCDGLVINAWRSIQFSPEATAEWASWPVTEADKSARQLACLAWREEKNLDRLAGDWRFHDPQVAGFWLYGVCCQIGPLSFDGPWTTDPVTGRIVKLGKPGVSRNRPHLSDNGRGVNRPQLREPGVSRDRPHLGDNGQGVNHAGLREPGVKRDRPQLGDNGRGVYRPQLREPGVFRDLPDLYNNGRGVNNSVVREPGVSRDLPHLSSDGQGVNRPQLREPGVGEDPEFHPVTMPELIRWFRWLSARIRHVRIVCGDWKRVCTTGAMWTMPVRKGDGPCGVFLDPPYATSERASGLYAEDGGEVASQVREWCIKNGDNPKNRIVLAGYDTEHTELEAYGWTCYEWYTQGFLSGGMGQTNGSSQQHRERMWASPFALKPGRVTLWQASLFDDDDND